MKRLLAAMNATFFVVPPDMRDRVVTHDVKATGAFTETPNPGPRLAAAVLMQFLPYDDDAALALLRDFAGAVCTR
jgi:hypothetical protein